MHGSRPYLALKTWLGVMLRLEFGRIFTRTGLHGLGLFLAVVRRSGLQRVDLALDLAAPRLSCFGAGR
jgi:hypothetical protein